jgi:hypothetical protein
MPEKSKEVNQIDEELDFEAKQNLLGFFDLLLKVDMRLNPQNYENNGSSDNTD